MLISFASFAAPSAQLAVFLRQSEAETQLQKARNRRLAVAARQGNMLELRLPGKGGVSAWTVGLDAVAKLLKTS